MTFHIVIVMVCFIILFVFGAQISADVQAHSTRDDVSFFFLLLRTNLPNTAICEFM